MKKGSAIFLLFLVLFASGCSHKIIAIGLDDAVQSTWNKLGEAYCKKKVIATDPENFPSATFQVITTYTTGVGSSLLLPINLTGETSLSELTAITVKFDLSKYDCEPGKEVRAITAGKFYELDKRSGTLKEIPAPNK
jgi:hypothetical protein